jgi:hypothetical protein
MQQVIQQFEGRSAATAKGRSHKELLQDTDASVSQKADRADDGVAVVDSDPKAAIAVRAGDVQKIGLIFHAQAKSSLSALDGQNEIGDLPITTAAICVDDRAHRMDADRSDPTVPGPAASVRSASVVENSASMDARDRAAATGL